MTIDQAIDRAREFLDRGFEDIQRRRSTAVLTDVVGTGDAADIDRLDMVLQAERWLYEEGRDRFLAELRVTLAEPVSDPPRGVIVLNPGARRIA